MKRIFELNGKEFIELNKLLKIMGVVASGGFAKIMIQEGKVLVNNKIELRVRRKLRKTDVVKFGSEEVHLH